MEKTLVLIKPEGVKRHLAGTIIQRFENAGLKIIGMKQVWVDSEFSQKHYSEHVGKTFYQSLEKYITEGPVIAIVLEGVNAVENVRKIVGGTEPKSSPPGTIRGDFAHMSFQYADSKGNPLKNLIHASGNTEEAKKEISLWFKDYELHSYKTMQDFFLE
ncbi:MAG TPA: nucleoside-diphosphate kinase [Candidatus Nanoarchaeia archaeon]|nr:nucleoside-diphosphate kinase [Candidatus Nanoarchaeia archaeon]